MDGFRVRIYGLGRTKVLVNIANYSKAEEVLALIHFRRTKKNR